MSIGLLFWVLFVIGFIFGGWSFRQPDQKWGFYGGGFLILVLLFLLGWRVFGFIVQG